MATKHVLFVFLLVVGLVASQFNDCNVNEEQNIKIANCTLAPKNVTKGVEQCQDDIIMATPVCKDVETTFIDSHEVSTQHCETSYHKYSVGSPVERRGMEDRDACQIVAATCLNETVVAPKRKTCNSSSLDDCNVVVEQNIDITDCTLESQNVPKVNGFCPMSDLLIPFQVCYEVITAFVTTFEITTPHCVLSYDVMSFESPVKRQNANKKTCEIQKATCNDYEEKIPKTRTCTGNVH